MIALMSRFSTMETKLSRFNERQFVDDSFLFFGAYTCFEIIIIHELWRAQKPLMILQSFPWVSTLLTSAWLMNTLCGITCYEPHLAKTRMIKHVHPTLTNKSDIGEDHTPQNHDPEIAWDNYRWGFNPAQLVNHHLLIHQFKFVNPPIHLP